MYPTTHGNSHCPVCGSPDCEGGNIEVFEGGCRQPCKCFNCDSEWNDIYEFAQCGDIWLGDEKYALDVADIVWGGLKAGLLDTYEILAEIHGFIPRMKDVETAFDFGFAQTWRDQAIELFREYGLETKPVEER